MNGALAITKKELKSYFYSPVAYIILGIFLFAMGVIFAVFVKIYHQYNMQQKFGGAQGITLDKVALYLYQNMAFILCLATPFLTMKLFAEERRQNTLELLFTVPLRGIELVIGKFLASFTLMLVMVAVSFIYVFFMILWGEPDLAVIGTTYLGLVMLVACFLSVGSLISAFSSSQAIAAIWTFIVLLMLWLFQAIGQHVTGSWLGIEWGQLLTFISPLSHFSPFGEGQITLKDVVYFLSFSSLMLFLTQRVVESNRWR